MNLLSVAKNTKYSFDAFVFVQKGLDFTVKRTHGEPRENEELKQRHITGQQLCLGLRDYAIEQYGALARTVLQRWRILNCEDFGHIVFALVEAKLMLKNEEDTIEDFMSIYDFSEAFTARIELKEDVIPD